MKKIQLAQDSVHWCNHVPQQQDLTEQVGSGGNPSSLYLGGTCFNTGWDTNYPDRHSVNFMSPFRKIPGQYLN